MPRASRGALEPGLRSHHESWPSCAPPILQSAESALVRFRFDGPHRRSVDFRWCERSYYSYQGNRNHL